MPSPGDIMAGRAFVLLYAHDSPLYQSLRLADRKIQQFAYNANRIGRSMLTMTSAAAAPMAIATRTYANFHDTMLEVRAVTQATGEDFDRLYEQAKRLGATTSFTASQVGAGMANLGRQGFKPAEIEAAIPAVLNLARATKTDLGEAADIAAGTLRALSMEASEMPRVADVLTAAANNSSQTLTDLGEAMKYVAPIADEAGMSVEQTAKAVGVMANMQIKGTMAGTAMRKMLGDLASEDAQAKLRRYNVEVLNLVDGSLRPFGDIMIDIGKAMAEMTNAQRIAFAQDLFGERAYGAALKLSKGGFDELAAAIDNAAGAAERTALSMDSGLGGVLRVLMSAIEGVQIALGEAIDEKMQEWGTTAKELAAATQKWIQENKQLIVTVTKIVAVLAALGATAIVVGTAATGLAAAINTISMAVATATLAVKGLSAAAAFLAANPLVLLAGGLVAIGIALQRATEYSANLSSEMNDLLSANTMVRLAERNRMKELDELAEKQNLSTSEMVTAKTIIAELTGKYGDLGVQVNETTGAIEGIAEAQKRLNEEQSGKAKQDIKAAMIEEQANIDELNKDIMADARWSFLWEWGFSTWQLDEREINRKEAERAVHAENLKNLQKQYAALTEDVDGYFEKSATVKKDAAERAKALASMPRLGEKPEVSGEESKEAEVLDTVSEVAERMNKEMQDRIFQYRLQRIDDEEQRAIKSINRRYKEELARAKELGANESLVENAKTKAIQAARENARKQREEEQKRQQEMAAASEERMRDETARVEIEKKYRGEIAKVEAEGGPGSAAKVKQLERQLEREQLELDRQRELREAKRLGVDPAIVNELYDARQALAEQRARQDRFAEISRGRAALRQAALAPTAQVGSLEAYQAFARHGDPAQRVREKSLRTLTDIDQNTKRAAEAAENFGVEEVDIND